MIIVKNHDSFLPHKKQKIKKGNFTSHIFFSAEYFM